jgi:hypothetical protein
MEVLEILGELSSYWVEHMVGQVASQKPDMLRRVRSMLEEYQCVIDCVGKIPDAERLVNHLVAVCKEIAQYYHIPEVVRGLVDEMDNRTLLVRAMPRIANDAPVAATGPEQRVQSVIPEERTAFEETQVLMLLPGKTMAGPNGYRSRSNGGETSHEQNVDKASNAQSVLGLR